MTRIWNKHKQTNTPLKRKVFVAMSGGVDSSVAALLLKKEGYDVYGIYMKEWVPPGIQCAAGDDRLMAARVAAHLDIPFAVWDFSEDYRQEVAEYMLHEYAEGRTPNPDVMCNKKIKFGIFLKRALEAGADYIATGHYIRLQREFTIYNLQFTKNDIENSAAENSMKIKNYKLKIASDSDKDQSYFLWTLTQEQLRHCLFPVGEHVKPEVRAIAKKAKIPSWDKKDSQGVCFVGKFDFAEFLRMQIPRREGSIVSASGSKIGTHDGFSFYTVGQRHGVSSGIKDHGTWNREHENNRPMYVAEKDVTTNTIVMAEEEDPALYKKELIVGDVHWISGIAPEFPLQCDIRIRYRQPLQKAIVTMLHDSCSMIHAATPQRAVAPGQSIVFYQNGEMLGGGIILDK